jgi:hypothetical protein
MSEAPVVVVFLLGLACLPMAGLMAVFAYELAKDSLRSASLSNRIGSTFAALAVSIASCILIAISTYTLGVFE